MITNQSAHAQPSLFTANFRLVDMSRRHRWKQYYVLYYPFTLLKIFSPYSCNNLKIFQLIQIFQLVISSPMTRLFLL